MNKSKKILCFALALGICSSAGSLAADGVDARVVSALSAEGVKFSSTSSQNIKVQLRTTDARDQLVFVCSDTDKEGEYEFREVFSAAYDGPPLTGAKLERLLVENGNNKIGGWRLSRGDSWVVAYAVRVSADADGATLRTAISLCAKLADALEKEWTGQDDL